MREHWVDRFCDELQLLVVKYEAVGLDFAELYEAAGERLQKVRDDRLAAVEAERERERADRERAERALDEE